MFKPHKNYEARKRSAVALIKYLLGLKAPDILRTHKRELLTIALWKLTTAEGGKYKTRFRSQGALNCTDTSKLRHEHVFQRGKMMSELENAAPDEVDHILKRADACTVTLDEHILLSKFDEEYGWDRYRRAEIGVFDTLNDEWFICPSP